jgi:hypothetical protein
METTATFRDADGLPIAVSLVPMEQQPTELNTFTTDPLEFAKDYIPLKLPSDEEYWNHFRALQPEDTQPLWFANSPHGFKIRNKELCQRAIDETVARDTRSKQDADNGPRGIIGAKGVVGPVMSAQDARRVVVSFNTAASNAHKENSHFQTPTFIFVIGAIIGAIGYGLYFKS